MSIESLPNELLDNICKRLTPADFVSLTRTCSHMAPVAQRLLYRHLSISSPSRRTSVIMTLARRPNLAEHVRTFAIRIGTDSICFRSFYLSLAAALANMTQLTSLDIFARPDVSWVLNGPPTVVYPRLSRFVSSFPWDCHVANFLSKTTALSELELESIGDLPAVLAPPPSPSSLALLSHFGGPVDVAKLIVPGRPLDSVHLSSGDLTDEDIHVLSESTAELTFVSVTTSTQPVPLLQAFVHHTPHLIYLRIMTTYSFSEAPDATFYENVAHALTSLRHLRAFELCGMQWGSTQQDSTDEGRVWQSKPITSDFPIESMSSQDDVQVDFFAY